MTERINGQGFRAADAAGTRRSEAAKPTRAESGSGSTAPTAPAPADTVSITQSGLLMSKLEEVVHGTPVVDANRVSAIKDALASGSYEIDDQRVADQILRFERNMLG
jgi:negative regulator of flagellin synthesis FlgM